jgi:alkylation response protein AidB-like acyl-CoA dehydrogenase
MDAVVDTASSQFELNEDQRAIQEMARPSPQTAWRRTRSTGTADKHFPADVIRETGPLGLGGIYVRDDVGGSALAARRRADLRGAVRMPIRPSRPSSRSTTWWPR